jgi:hypothetical protein
MALVEAKAGEVPQATFAEPIFLEIDVHLEDLWRMRQAERN